MRIRFHSDNGRSANSPGRRPLVVILAAAVILGALAGQYPGDTREATAASHRVDANCATFYTCGGAVFYSDFFGGYVIQDRYYTARDGLSYDQWRVSLIDYQLVDGDWDVVRSAFHGYFGPSDNNFVTLRDSTDVIVNSISSVHYGYRICNSDCSRSIFTTYACDLNGGFSRCRLI